MKCPRCGERWFDAEDEYSLDVCDRCESDPEHVAEIAVGSTIQNGQHQTIVATSKRGPRSARKRTARRTDET